MNQDLPKSNASWGRKKGDTQSDEVFITHHSVVHPTVENPASNLRTFVEWLEDEVCRNDHFPRFQLRLPFREYRMAKSR